MFIKSGILLVGAATLLAITACGSNDAAQSVAPVKLAAPVTDAVAATVNGSPISERFVGLMLKRRAELGKEAGVAARKELIDRLAMQLILTQEAVKKGLDKDTEVSDRIELNRQSILVNAYLEDYLKSNSISDDALKAEYDKIKAQATGNEYKARHILVEKEAAAKGIIARLKKNPSTFAALAKKKSIDPGSKVNGGDLGWFDAEAMVPEFAAAVAKLGKGEFTAEPVRTQFGYHVILLDDTRPRPVQPLEQIKEGLIQKLQQENLRKLFDELKTKAKIEIAQAAAPAPTQAQAAMPEQTGESK